MKSKNIELNEYIKENRRKVQLENLNAKQGFIFEIVQELYGLTDEEVEYLCK